MKKLLLLAALCSTFCVSAQADFYVGAGYGLAINKGSVIENAHRSTYKDSSVYSLSGGVTLPLPLFDLRGEVEYFRTRPETKSLGTKQLDALMLNATGVIPLIPFIDPYVGFGVGYGRYDHNNTSAWQALMGVEYAFETNPFVVGAEYRYLELTETNGKHDNSSKYRTHGLMLKVKYTF